MCPEQSATEAGTGREQAAAEAIRLQQEQFIWMKAKDERGQMKQGSIAVQLKLFCDVNKNVAP
jgi:hypothetical protein